MAWRRRAISSVTLKPGNWPREKGIIAVELEEGDYLVGAAITDGKHDVMLFSDAAKAVRFEEDDVQLGLRFDLTVPLARYVAENYDALPKPFRRYQTGPVWRNEKPGPGRYRQFMQCDADTVGTDNVAADAEACMLMADVIAALGLPADQFKIKINNRKLLNGLMAAAGVTDGCATSASSPALTMT